jgi:hypothetical protein
MLKYSENFPHQSILVFLKMVHLIKIELIVIEKKHSAKQLYRVENQCIS